MRKSVYICVYEEGKWMLVSYNYMFFMFLSIGILFNLFEPNLHATLTVYGQILLAPESTEQQATEGREGGGQGLTNNFSSHQTTILSSTETSRTKEQSDEISILAQNVTYLDPINKFMIQYPADWTAKSDGLADYTDRVTFYSPLQNLNDLFPSQITISIIVYKQNISLAEYARENIANLNQSSNIQVVGTNPYVLDGNPANITVYSSISLGLT